MIQELVYNMTPPQDSMIKISGILGGSVSAFGLSVNQVELTFWSSVLADVGVFIGSIVAALTLVYTVYKGKRNK